MAKKKAPRGDEAPIAVSCDRLTGKLNDGAPAEIAFRPDGISPEQMRRALTEMDGALPFPTSIKEAEFVLWLSGMRPHHQPTRGEQMLAAMIKSKQSQQAASRETEPAAETPPQRKRRTKPRTTVKQVQDHWQEVLNSGNRDLIHEYLTLAETALASRIGCSRNTLRGCEGFQNRGIALREFNRQTR
jgi:hypothetical protein